MCARFKRKYHSSNLGLWSRQKLTICFASKIPFLIPLLLDDSFHHAIYAIMRQPVGEIKKEDTKTFSKPV